MVVKRLKCRIVTVSIHEGAFAAHQEPLLHSIYNLPSGVDPFSVAVIDV